MACRKNESAEKALKTPNEHNFFNDHLSPDPLLITAINFVKRENEKYQFVERIVDQIGFPYWDKSIITTGYRKKGLRNNSEGNTIFIPFVLQNQNLVNASLVICISPTDTTFEFLCDWQYKERTHGSFLVDSTAENFAVLFMMLSSHVFGDTSFFITDSSLFVFGTPTNGRVNHVNLRPPVASRMSNYQVAKISDWTIGLICFGGYFCGTPWAAVCSDIDGCDYLDPCQSGTSCYPTNDCFEGWVWDSGSGGGSSSSGGSSGTGTGGGSGSGNPWYPPVCPIGIERSALYEVCTPGWNPDPGGGSTIKPPCDKIAPLKTDQPYKDAINDLKSRLTMGKEFAYIQKSIGGAPIGIYEGEDGKCEVKVPIFQTTPSLRSYMHSHYNACPCPIFSPMDFQTMFNLFEVGKADGDFTFTVVTSVGVYSMVFNDMDAYTNFYKKYFDENTATRDAKELERGYDWYGIDRANTAEVNEEKFLTFIKDENIGVKLLKATPDLSGYSEISLTRGGVRFEIPCN